MLLNHLFLASLLPYLQSDPPAGGGNPPEPPTPPPADPPLGENGEAALKAERDARKDADKRAKAAEAKLAEIETAKVKADEAKAKEQGEWQKLAETRDADLTTATTDLTAANAELETLRSYANADVESVTKRVKELKDNPAAKLLLDFHPGDEATVPQLLAWAQKAKAGLPDMTKETKRGAGFDPPASGPGGFNLEAEMAKARQTGKYRV